MEEQRAWGSFRLRSGAAAFLANEAGGTTDFSGYSVVYLINGIRVHVNDDPHAEIICGNVGKSQVKWAV